MFVLYRGQPPDYVLKEAKNTNKFFKCVATVNSEDGGQFPMSRQSAFQPLTEEEFEVVSVSWRLCFKILSILKRKGCKSMVYFPDTSVCRFNKHS